MTIKTMFSGALVAVGWDFVWTDSANPAGVTITIPDGTYYVLGDGSADDLLSEMADQVGIVSFANLQDTITDAGIVGFRVDSGTATIDASPGGSSAALGAALGFSVSTLPLTTAYSYAYRPAPTLAVGTRCSYKDIPTRIGRRSVSESDQYARSVLSLSAMVSRYQVGVLYGGPHRSADWTDYDAWLSFFDNVIFPGTLCRWYPDATVTTAYAQHTNPFGYHLVRITSPSEWTPRELESGWYRWYTTELTLLEQTS